MKAETLNRIKNSYVLYRVQFHTVKGTYVVRVLKHKSKDKIYYLKTRDKAICELIKFKPGFYKCNYYDTLVKGKDDVRKIFLQVRQDFRGDYRLQIRERGPEGEILRDIDILKLIKEKENKNNA